MEAGVFAGKSWYQGDLQPKFMDTRQLGTSFGIFTRYNLSPYFAFKATFSKNEIKGSDSYADRNVSNRIRNLNFRSDIVEASLTGEWHFGYNVRSGHISAPYLYAGVGMFHFNPKTLYQGEWVALQPLGTEGQNINSTNYKLYQWCLPFGFGFRVALSDRVALGAEAGARLTWTDYLDDVSSYYPDLPSLQQTDKLAYNLSFRSSEISNDLNVNNMSGVKRGDAGARDWYYTTNFSIIISLADKYKMDYEKKYRIFDMTPAQEMEVIKNQKVIIQHPKLFLQNQWDDTTFYDIFSEENDTINN